MIERCQAYDKGRHCRKSKNLTRCRITIHREPSFNAKLPEGAIILLCPDHLRLSQLEALVMQDSPKVRSAEQQRIAGKPEGGVQ